MKKKMLSALLAVTMILTLLPVSALSSEIPVNYPDIEIEEEGFSYPENPITYSDSEDGISASLPHYQASTEEPTGRFARRQLYSLDYADELLELYDGFVAAAETFSTTFVISLEAALAVSATNKDEDEHKRVFKTAMLAYANDYPEHFWVDLSHGVKLGTVLIDEYTAEYRVTFKNLEDVSNQTVCDQFEQACLDIIEEVGITSSTTDYDKALLLHDYLVQNVAYTSGRDHSHDAYGAVIE